MNITIDYLLEELAKRFNPETPQPEKLISSGKKFSGWLTDRIHYKDQVLINAIECQESEMQSTLRHMMIDIEKEFSGIAKVKVLPYPYDNVEEMRQIVDNLIAHFGAPISANDVIFSIKSSSQRNEPISGYIILTIISLPVII